MCLSHLLVVVSQGPQSRGRYPANLHLIRARRVSETRHERREPPRVRDEGDLNTGRRQSRVRVRNSGWPNVYVLVDNGMEIKGKMCDRGDKYSNTWKRENTSEVH